MGLDIHEVTGVLVFMILVSHVSEHQHFFLHNGVDKGRRVNESERGEGASERQREREREREHLYI